MPKLQRTASANRPFRSHSRSSSGSKLSSNLHITHRDQNLSKGAADKGRKNGHQPHDSHTKISACVSSIQRANLGDRIHPLGNLNNTKQRQSPDPGITGSTGFAIPDTGEGDDDDGAWVSSESGVATPIDHEAGQVSGRQPTSELRDVLQVQGIALPSDCTSSQISPPSLERSKQAISLSVSDAALQPCSPHKRASRPTSYHSVKDVLRPHPLIRGQSYGHIQPTRPSPLQPLTIRQDFAVTTSPTGTIYDHHLPSTSPTSSLRTVITSPASSEGPHRRRTSVSSVSTVPPTHSSTPQESVIRSRIDRKRAHSSFSHNSSSAALSSLVHLPTVTRPTSPQAISFFPPVNPHANIEGIHPLLPTPYLQNHLTILSRRTPIRESFNRVITAKRELLQSSS